ncbi:hypothetical protein YC2023_030455 [Brassica napus]|uniref:(rape) hypothetical protein n=1 Tax=Brassica napus TaxID=3708 RepID=A0A816W552_BRANA|nr:unnamed protein product [Brassica napus]
MGSSACTYSTVHAFTITRMGYTTRALSNTAIAGTLSVSPSHALPFPQLRLTAAGCTGAAQDNIIAMGFPAGLGFSLQRKSILGPRIYR